VTEIAVIGGGLAGLAAAVSLADNGQRVSLFEKRPRLGGRATSYTLPDGRHIDNCQHVTLGCCTNLDHFYRRIETADKIRYYTRLVFQDPSGRRGVISRSFLPAPLHLALSFAAFPLLDWSDKLGIASALLQIIRSRGLPARASGASMLEWLTLQKQTPRAIERFWRVVLVSALNEELDRTDAAYGAMVLWKAFLSNRRGFEVGIPSIPLGELYDSAGPVIERSGGKVRIGCGVAEVRFSNGAIENIRLDDATEVAAEYYVFAVPFDRFLKMLPAEALQEQVFADIRNLTVSPITSVHLWFDRRIMAEPFLTLVDTTSQWIFNRSDLCPASGEPAGQYLQVVISASHSLTSRSQQEIIELCTAEVRQAIPSAALANVTRSVVVRENAASFSPSPGCDRWRPTQRTPIQNLFLAGDWTQTGWPATMEGAVRSGYLAAEAILAVMGKPQTLLQPDLVRSAG